jgi:hypothetical protein
MAKELAVNALIRYRQLEQLQKHYASFIPFLEDVMELLGFTTSEVQHDIANYIAYGPHYLMVQAQRGQAKTTIAAAYAVWSLIQDPRHRVLILSAGGSLASDISTLIIRIIMTMDELECMRPDTNNGDRSSVEHFDVHYSLKGVDKSPSVKCLGITASLSGNRADLLLADDIESPKNSLTATQRAQLLHLTLEFTSICSTGRIVWLGTPQSMESIYNTLPGRGVTVRIWPGRYPTMAQREHYGEHLAPYLIRKLEINNALAYGGGMLGDQGQPLDPVLLNEQQLQKKEMDQGTSYFQLQHMLNTRLMDALRFPLKPHQLIVMPCQTRMPLTVVRGYGGGALKDFHIHGFAVKMSIPHEVSQETAVLQGIMAYIDPAGGGANGDETAYAVTGFLNGNVYLLDVGGIPGGYTHDTLKELADRISIWKPNVVKIEKNMGFGAFREVFVPVLHAVHKCAIEDDMVTGQKERRIIGTLEPVIGRGALIVNESLVERDIADCGRYGHAHRLSYSFFHQLAKITQERGALVHDDRLDAVEGAVRHWQALIQQDQDHQVKLQREREHAKSIEDPMGHGRYSNGPTARKGLFGKYRR